ncbi:MAG: hypothetical protein K1X83_13580 [Oligoflexia bacterium]|nr:hypothetical protein [Oligoflexia bacterium]
MRTALKVVESAFQECVIELPQDGEAHSLHGAVPYPLSIRHPICAHFIDRYSRKGGTVLDPFCGSGATPLETNLRGRVAFFSDRSSFAVKLARSKIEASDITEVTLRLQQYNLRRPINVKSFDQLFAPFYDLNTFREIVNLRSAIQAQYDRTARFMELLAIGLLHGHSAGYFSVYSLPQVSLTPQDQVGLNIKRNQSPDYRAVAPRLLRKACSVLRDGIPSILRHVEIKNRYAACDARNLSYVTSSSVDLCVTAPPGPLYRDPASQMWLRLWFAGVTEGSLGEPGFEYGDVPSWRDFMNEWLLELARVTRSSGRAVLELSDVSLGGKPLRVDRELLALVNEQLGRYWEPEVSFTPKARSTALQNSLDAQEDPRAAQRSRILVLKRR